MNRILRKLFDWGWGFFQVEFHFDYCDVLAGGDQTWPVECTGQACSEDCTNHPGEKIMVVKRTGEVRWP